MSLTITTATGRVIDCDAVTLGRAYPVLHIHTHALSRVESTQIFDDPLETAVLTETRDVLVDVELEGGATERRPAQETRVYRGWTDLHSVERSPFVDGALLIWLNRPPELT